MTAAISFDMHIVFLALSRNTSTQRFRLFCFLPDRLSEARGIPPTGYSQEALCRKRDGQPGGETAGAMPLARFPCAPVRLIEPKSVIRLAGAFPMAEMVISGILSASARSLLTDLG